MAPRVLCDTVMPGSSLGKGHHQHKIKPFSGLTAWPSGQASKSQVLRNPDLALKAPLPRSVIQIPFNRGWTVLGWQGTSSRGSFSLSLLPNSPCVKHCQLPPDHPTLGPTQGPGSWEGMGATRHPQKLGCDEGICGEEGHPLCSHQCLQNSYVFDLGFSKMFGSEFN